MGEKILGFFFGIFFIILMIFSLVFYTNGIIQGNYDSLEGFFEYYFNPSKEHSKEISKESSAKPPVLKASKETSEEVFEQPSEEVSEQPSEEVSEQPSKEVFEQPSEEVSEQPSEEVSKQPSEEVSEQPSEEVSEQPSEEVFEQPSEEISEQPSEEVSEQPSEEVSEQPSEEVSEEKIYQEIMQEFPEHDFAYALYDIQSGNIVTEYNTSKMFRTGCTIKPAVILYLLSERNITDNWETKKIQILKSDDDKEGVSTIRNDINIKGTKNWGDWLTVKYLVYVTLVYSDNIGYQMLCREYFPNQDFRDFNRFMKNIGSNIKLGEDEIIGTVYTAATVGDQLAVWKAIYHYNGPGSKIFMKHLTSTEAYYDYKYAEHVLTATIPNWPYKRPTKPPKALTASMAGWVNGSSTFNECYIVEGKYIAVILTATGKSTPIDKDIDTRPLEKIVAKLQKAWEAYR